MSRRARNKQNWRYIEKFAEHNSDFIIWPWHKISSVWHGFRPTDIYIWVYLNDSITKKPHTQFTTKLILIGMISLIKIYAVEFRWYILDDVIQCAHKHLFEQQRLLSIWRVIESKFKEIFLKMTKLINRIMRSNISWLVISLLFFNFKYI